MKAKETLSIILLSTIIVCLFFYKTIIFHQIPFPGDLLIGSPPYKTQSYLGYAPGGYPNLAQGADVITEMFPWKYFSIQELKAGQIPFWNPHNFAGNLHMQNYQTAIFYPLNIVFFIFSFTTSWSIFIILQPFLAMMFMYLFLRNLNLNKHASRIGGIAFAFSSYMTVWIEYGNIGSTFLWLPLVLFSLQKFLEKPKIQYFLLSIFSLTMSFLGGYIQGVFYIYVIAVAYVIYMLIRQKSRIKVPTLIHHSTSTSRFRLNSHIRDTVSEQSRNSAPAKKNKNLPLSPLPFTLILIFLLPVFLSAYQILPTYDLFRSSTRGTYSLSQISFLLQPLYYWVTIFVPDLFGNPAHRNYFLPITYIERVMYVSVPFIFFTLLGIVRIKNKMMLFFLSIGLLVLLLTTNLPLIQYIYRLPIPMVSTTVPTRALSIFIFCMIVVGSYGIDYWLSKANKEKYTVPMIFIGAYIFIWLFVLLFPKIFPQDETHTSIMLHNLVIPTVFAIATVVIFYLKKISTKLAVLLLLLLVVFDLFSFFQKITPFSPSQLIYPQTPVISYLQKNAGINRFWGYGSAYVPANFQTYDGTYSPEGNDPLHIKDYGILLASSSNGQYPNLLPRPDANIAPGYGMTDMQNPYRQQILNVLGIKYILYDGDGTGVFPESAYSLTWQQSPWQIYENNAALPRYFLSSQFQVIPDVKTTLNKIYTTDIKHTLLLNTKPSQTIDPTAKGTVLLTTYLPNTVSFTTNTTGNTLLFLSDTYFHSWIAKVDNGITPIYKADLTFRAVEVPKGQHSVSFIYQPTYFYIGLYLAGFGVLVTMLYSLYLYKYEKK